MNKLVHCFVFGLIGDIAVYDVTRETGKYISNFDRCCPVALHKAVVLVYISVKL